MESSDYVEFYCPACNEFSSVKIEGFLLRPGEEIVTCPICETRFRVSMVYYAFPSPTESGQHPEPPRGDGRTTDRRNEET